MPGTLQVNTHTRRALDWFSRIVRPFSSLSIVFSSSSSSAMVGIARLS